MLGEMLNHRFLQRIEAFLRRTKLPAAVLGERALKDPAFVLRMRAGREARESTQARMLEWMAEYEGRRAGVVKRSERNEQRTTP